MNDATCGYIRTVCVTRVGHSLVREQCSFEKAYNCSRSPPHLGVSRVYASFSFEVTRLVPPPRTLPLVRYKVERRRSGSVVEITSSEGIYHFGLALLRLPGPVLVALPALVLPMRVLASKATGACPRVVGVRRALQVVEQ